MKRERAKLIRKAWREVEERYPDPDRWPGHTIMVPVMPEEARPYRLEDSFPAQGLPPLPTLRFERTGFKLCEVQYNIVHCEGLIVSMSTTYEENAGCVH